MDFILIQWNISSLVTEYTKLLFLATIIYLVYSFHIQNLCAIWYMHLGQWKVNFIDNANILRIEFIQYSLCQRHSTLDIDKGYSLDLLFTNVDGLNFCNPAEVLSKVDSHHLPCIFKFPYKCKLYNDLEFEITYREFRKCDYNKINHDLGCKNWTRGMAKIDCEGKVEFLYFCLNKVISEYVPLQTSWFGRGRIYFIRQKIHAHWTFDLSNCEKGYIEFISS